jgi:type IV pilus assembly protein PilE
MRKGFTLLELIIVIIIIGVLATLGFVQYSTVIEKARGAEARAVISTLRSQVAAKSMGGETISSTNIGIGSGVPSTCTGQTTNYFAYGIDGACSGTACTFTAPRCTTGGKSPVGPTGYPTLTLTYPADTWGGTGNY